MKYSRLLTKLSNQMSALLTEEEHTAKRMFESTSERETVNLLTKVEDLRKRHDALQKKVNVIVFWNQKFSNDEKEKLLLQDKAVRRRTRELEEERRSRPSPKVNLNLKRSSK